jgi:hypothetical protein
MSTYDITENALRELYSELLGQAREAMQRFPDMTDDQREELAKMNAASNFEYAVRLAAGRAKL